MTPSASILGGGVGWQDKLLGCGGNIHIAAVEVHGIGIWNRVTVDLRGLLGLLRSIAMYPRLSQ